MLDGVNDAAAARARADRARARRAVQAQPDSVQPVSRAPSSARARASASARSSRCCRTPASSTTVRKTRGDDIDAACGQLAGQVQDRIKRRLATRIVADRRALIAMQRASACVTRSSPRRRCRARRRLPDRTAGASSPPAQPRAAGPADPAGTAAADPAGTGDAAPARRDPHRARRGLLRARADGRRARGARRSREKLDPDVRADLQPLRPRLRDDGRAPRAESSFAARSSSRRTMRTPATTGAGTCARTGARSESIAEFEVAIRNPLYKTPEIALVNAGKCSVAIGDSNAADQYFRRALQLRPNDAAAAYNLALLSYRGARLAESRALMRVVMQQTAPPPEALFLGMCIERKLGDRAGRAVVRHAASQPLSGFGRDPRDRQRRLRVMARWTRNCRQRRARRATSTSAGAARCARRAKPPACRSTRSRSI